MKSLYNILLLLSLMVLASCSGDEVASILPEVPEQPPVWELSDVPVAFRSSPVVASSSGNTTRGVLIGELEARLPNDDDGNQPWRPVEDPWIIGDAFSVTGLYYFDTMTLLAQQFMNTDVSYDDVPLAGADPGDTPVPTEKQWIYSPQKYWPNQGYVDFYAQYPSNEMLEKMRVVQEHTTPDPGLTLPDDMEEDTFVGSARQRRAASAPMKAEGDPYFFPNGISSLRYYHENPLDTVLSLRLRQLPHSIDAPETTTEGTYDAVPIVEYDDARHQPDLMYAHHPHLSKENVVDKVDLSFTHAMMAVRFWLKGFDREIKNPDDPNYDVTGTYTASRFRNLGNFTINSVSFGPVYTAGECIAYDNTDWAKYYENINPGLKPDYDASEGSTGHNDKVPVKLRYVWKYGDVAPEYTVKRANADGVLVDSNPYTMAPPYGGCEQRTPVDGGSIPKIIDAGYPLPKTPITDIFTQRCDFSLIDYDGGNPFSSQQASTSEGWRPDDSVPILPVLDATTRGADRRKSAFIIPPQMFLNGNPYVKVTFTVTEDLGANTSGTPSTSTVTTETVAIPMHSNYLNVEDGEILDLYFTFDIDGDDYFHFYIDAKITPWQYGGEQNDKWTNW